MVCDFGKIKKHLRQWLDETLDHKLLVPIQAKQLTTEAETRRFHFTFGQGHTLTTSGPDSAFCLIPTERITPESVARWCIRQLTGDFGPGVTNIELSFRPEHIDGPYYHYSHGLKKHAGNCQRIAHGHRSTLKIWRNGEPCHTSMAKIADEWRDIYIGTRADITGDQGNHWDFGYEASQGDFYLRIPKSAVYLMDDDTTVENICAHLAAKLKAASPQDHIVVKAFEGIGKGAEVAC
jgi:6-pyruvoyl-tetrahydropterin synthase